jgi:hypothetical protein
MAAWIGPRVSRQRIETSAPAIMRTGPIRSAVSATAAISRWIAVAAWSDSGASQSARNSATRSLTVIRVNYCLISGQVDRLCYLLRQLRTM